MRPVKKITAEEENFRTEPSDYRGISVIRRDYIEPEPVGTIVLMAFRITGYDRDCDGSALARLQQIGKDGKCTGYEVSHIGLYGTSEIVVTQKEWTAMFSSQVCLSDPPRILDDLEKVRKERDVLKVRLLMIHEECTRQMKNWERGAAWLDFQHIDKITRGEVKP